MQNSIKIIVFTDGSSRGNPGPGGWGTVIVYGSEVKELGGREGMTTNNKMELTATIKALEYINKKNIEGEISLYSDSQYVIKGMTEWISGWQKKGWINSQKKPVLNRELWEELLSASGGKNIKWIYVKGHHESSGNNRCDEIATAFADNLDIKLHDGSLDSYPIKVV